MAFVIISIVVMLIAFYLVYTLYFKKKYNPEHQAKVSGQYAEIDQEIQSGKENIIQQFLSDKTKLQPLKEAVKNDKILGITSCIEMQSTADKLRGFISPVKRVIVDNFYLIATENELHYIDFNGVQVVDHLVFNYSNLSNVQLGQMSALEKTKFDALNQNVAANMAGNSKVWKLSFTSQEKNYSIYLYDTIIGYPIFEFDQATKMKSYPGDTQFNYKMLMQKDKPKTVLMEGRILPLIGEDFRTTLKTKLNT